MGMFYFILHILGGHVVHSFGRLILDETVITDKQQLQPPDNDRGDGLLACRVSSGRAGFTYHGLPYRLPTFTSLKVYEIRSGSSTTVVIIKGGGFNNFVNFNGNCNDIHHYLFLSNGE